MQAANDEERGDLWNLRKSDEDLILRHLAGVGVVVRSLSSNEWDEPFPEAIPVLTRWLYEPIDPIVKTLALRILGYEWAYPGTYPAIRKCFEQMAFPGGGSFDEFQFNLVAGIARTPAKLLWPDILAMARREDLGGLRGLLLARAGKFRNHPDAVLALLVEYAGSTDPQVEVGVARGLGFLQDPRGIAILERVNELTPYIAVEKKKSLAKIRSTQP